MLMNCCTAAVVVAVRDKLKVGKEEELNVVAAAAAAAVKDTLTEGSQAFVVEVIDDAAVVENLASVDDEDSSLAMSTSMDSK